MKVGDKVYITTHGRDAEDDDYRTNLACVYMCDWLEVISE